MAQSPCPRRLFLPSYAAITFLLARESIRLFIQEEGALEFGTLYLKVVAFFYPFLGINFILNGVVRGKRHCARDGNKLCHQQHYCISVL
ncbi:MATE family efflux transporter [Bacillus sp. V3-13]|uniref:MATE family efflux transporter n=1 Tax=Bacillus sp. V3-13 TaxID=2053728 RepID=UPI0027E4EC89|nr:MATE family efflux transporter [Bacillus sp. V3-13]